MLKTTEMIQLEIRKCREKQFAQELNTKLSNLTRGLDGEEIVENFLKEYGHPSWKVLPNYCFYKGKIFQADFVVIMDTIVLLVEVKNYHGVFRLKGNECLLNDKLLNGNIIGTMKDRLTRLRQIVHQVDPLMDVKGVMIFVDEMCEVHVDEQLPFDIVMKHEMRRYFAQFPKRSYWNVDYLVRVMDQHRVPNPYKPKSMLPSEFARLRTGFDCKKCGSFQMTTSYKLVVCQACGCTEPKHAAVSRCALQLRYLFCDYPEMITLSNVHEFCGGVISKDGVKKIMAKHFISKGKTNKAYFVVPIPPE